VTLPVVWSKTVAFGVSKSTAIAVVKSVQSPMATPSGSPSALNVIRRHGTASSHAGFASSALLKTSTMTDPARTGRWARVPLTTVDAPLMVRSSPRTSCEL